MYIQLQKKKTWTDTCWSLNLSSSQIVINLVLIKNLNRKPETIKLLEKHIWEKLQGISLGSNFMNMSPKSQVTKTNKRDYMKLKQGDDSEKAIYRMGKGVHKPYI